MIADKRTIKVLRRLKTRAEKDKEALVYILNHRGENVTKGINRCDEEIKALDDSICELQQKTDYKELFHNTKSNLEVILGVIYRCNNGEISADEMKEILKIKTEHFFKE